MITKLRLRNWKSHLDSEFEFSPGVNALIGIMGSGKSSIVQAISFALFGDFPALNKLKLSDIIMRKPQRKAFAEVEIFFTANGRQCSVKRVVEQNKGTTLAEMRENGRLVAVDSRQVTDAVERALQMDYTLFCRAVYSEQNSLDYFLNLPRGKRTEHIDEMLQLDRFESVRSAAATIRNRLTSGIEEKAKILHEILGKENIGEKMQKIKSELASIRKSFYSLNKELSDVLTKKSGIEKLISFYEEKEADLQQLREKLTGLKSGTEELNKTIEKRKSEARGHDPKSLGDEIKRQGLKLKSLKAEYENNKGGLGEKEGLLSSLRAKKEFLEEKELPRISRIVSEYRMYAGKVEEIINAIGSEPEKSLEKQRRASELLKGDFSKANAEKESLLESIIRLEMVDAKCPLCDSLIEKDRKERLLEKKRDKVEQFNKECGEFLAKIESEEKATSALEVRVKEYLRLKQKLEDYKGAEDDVYEMQKQLDALTGGIKKVEPEVSSLKAECSAKEEEIKGLEIETEKLCLILNSIESIKELESRKSEYEGMIKSIEADIAGTGLQVSDIDIAGSRRELQKLNGIEGEIGAMKKSFEERIVEKEEEVGELAERQCVIESEKDKIEADKAAAEKLDRFCGALKATQIQLREAFLKTVNASMHGLWGRIYPYGDFSGIRLCVNEQYGDYVLELKGSDGWVPADAGVSGGERSIACLALRIAFSMAFIPNLKWLILDEPTHNLDANAIEQLAGVFRDKIGEIVEQLFLITHEEELSEGVTGGSIYRLERDKAEDGVTRTVKTG